MHAAAAAIPPAVRLRRFHPLIGKLEHRSLATRITLRRGAMNTYAGPNGDAEEEPIQYGWECFSWNVSTSTNTSRRQREFPLIYDCGRTDSSKISSFSVERA
jgi:hypothetical protein